MKPEDRIIAANVRAELARRRLTARGLAEEMGIPERGLRQRLRAEVAFRPAELADLADHLDVTVDYLITGREDSK